MGPRKLLGEIAAALAKARLAIDQAVLMYNNFRPHCSLGMRKPSQAHKAA